MKEIASHIYCSSSVAFSNPFRFNVEQISAAATPTLSCRVPGSDFFLGILANKMNNRRNTATPMIHIIMQ